jgi:hypothetical protein
MIMTILTLQKLEKTEYVLIEKTFKGKYPQLDRVIHESATRLAQIKKKHDPDGLFFVHNGVGSEQWTPDGFTRL